MEMSRLTRDRTAETVSRDHILERERGQGKKHFSIVTWPRAGLATWYQVDPYSALFDDHTHIHINISELDIISINQYYTKILIIF